MTMESSSEIIDILSQSPLFGALATEKLQVIASCSELKSTDSQTVLVKEGDTDQSIFMIQKGEVKVTKKISDIEKELTRLSTGDTVGEMALIDKKPRSASIISTEPTSYLTIEISTLLEDEKHREIYHAIFNQ